jgi:hypothetical protein
VMVLSLRFEIVECGRYRSGSVLGVLGTLP